MGRVATKLGARSMSRLRAAPYGCLLGLYSSGLLSAVDWEFVGMGDRRGICYELGW